MKNQIQKIGLLLAVFSVVFIAGCVGGPFESLFGQPGEVNEAPPDIVAVQNENIIPQPPITAGEDFTVSFEIKNVDDTNPVPDVNVQLYDWGLCGKDALKDPWKASGSYFTQSLGRMGPGQSKPIDMTLKAPTAAQLGNLPGRCPVRYKVNYTFNASTSTSAEVISDTRLRQLQTAGQPPSYTPITDIGIGPIKIYMSPVSAMPAKTESTVYVSIQVQNKGTGTYLKIEQNELILKVPSEWTLLDNCGNEFGAYTGKTETGYTFYSNNQTRGIDLVGADKKTFEIRCGFKMPDKTKVPETKTYYLFATLDYNYDLIREMNVDIKSQ